MQGSANDVQGQNSASSAGVRAGYTADPPCGVQVEEREGDGRAGTASLLALAHDLSASPQPDSRETPSLTDDSVSLLFPQQSRWR